jgi:predicted transcriptional regulator
MIDNMLAETFSECGLSLSESRVLLCLFERGGGSAGMAARLLGMKRPTVYFTLNNLAGYGLVTKKKVGARTVFVPAEPEALPRILEERARARYEIVHRAAGRLPRLLEPIFSKQAVHALRGYEIEAFDSMATMYQALERMLSGRELYAIWNPQVSTTGRAKSIVREFLRRTALSEARILDLMVPGPMTEWYRRLVSNPRHEMRLLPTHVRIASDLAVVEDSIFFVHYERGDEFAVRVTHQTCAATMRAAFELLWELLGPGVGLTPGGA